MFITNTITMLCIILIDVIYYMQNVLPRLLAAGVKQVQLALHEPATHCNDWLPSLSESAFTGAKRPQGACTEAASGQESSEAASEVARQDQGQGHRQGQGQGQLVLGTDDSVADNQQLQQARHHAQAKLDDLAAKAADRQPAADPADMTAVVPELQQTQLDLEARLGNPDACSKGMKPATSGVAEAIETQTSVEANDTSCRTLHRGTAVGQGRSVAQGRAVDQGRAEDPDTAVGQGRAVGQARAVTQSQQNVSWLLRTEPVAGCVTTAEAVARY